MWPVWVETAPIRNKKPQAGNQANVACYSQARPLGMWGGGKALGVMARASVSDRLGSKPALPFTGQVSTSYFTSLSLRVPVVTAIVKIKRETLLSLIRNPLNSYTRPLALGLIYWRPSILATYTDSQTQEDKKWSALYFSIF